MVQTGPDCIHAEPSRVMCASCDAGYQMNADQACVAGGVSVAMSLIAMMAAMMLF